MDIVPVGSRDRVEQVVAVLTLAFCDDPVTRWLYRTASGHLDGFPSLIRAFGRFAFENGTARLTADGAGAAVWLPPGLHTDDGALGAALEPYLDPALSDDVDTFFGAMDDHHPAGDHWYLPLIGVEPHRRGQGLGAALLDEALRRCDAEHAVAYLESTNPRNVSLYRRFGFEPLGTIQVGSSPVMTPMLRAAR